MEKIKKNEKVAGKKFEELSIEEMKDVCGGKNGDLKSFSFIAVSIISFIIKG